MARVDALFRDSHRDDEGMEEVVHEWSLEAAVDPSTLRFVSCQARVGHLPYPECPGAANSAGRLSGMPVEGLRRAVSTTFVGTTTCTHLNDTLRSLADLGGLLRALRPAARA